jgi:hypothetical protein
VRGAEEGEQLEQVEAGKLGVAEALADQRGVEQDDGGVGSDADRLAAADCARFLGRCDPDAAVAGVERGIRERRRHGRDDRGCGTKGKRRAAYLLYFSSSPRKRGPISCRLSALTGSGDGLPLSRE